MRAWIRMPKKQTPTKNKSSAKQVDGLKSNSRPLKITQKTRQRKLPDVWRLSIDALRIVWRGKGVLSGIILFFGLAYLIIVTGFSGGSNVSSIKQQFAGAFHGSFSQLYSGLGVYAVLLSSIGNSSSGTSISVAGFMVVVAILALIWAYRQILNGAPIRIRDAYYRGMYPLIPFLGVLLIISLELIPLTLGISLYTIAVYDHIAVNLFEKYVFGVISLGLASLSFYWLSSSLIALYIVTLPDMTPIKALKAAKPLVKARRLAVILRVLYLPLIILLVSIIIILPVIIVFPVAAQAIFMLLSLVFIVVANAYMYNLYRELIEDE